MNSEAIPITLIGGYLGSGKTTLVNHLLRNSLGARIAVLVNDFGDLPIDSELIESVDGDVINLSGGCVCCSYGNDLSMALMDIMALDMKPEHIVIETSGVALPGAIASSLSLMQGLQLLGIIVLANADTIRVQAEDRYVGDTIHRQLQHADVIVLNKTDLLSMAAVDTTRQWLKEQWPNARHIRSVQSEVPVNLLLDRTLAQIQVSENKRASVVVSTPGSGTFCQSRASHASLFSTFSITVPPAVDPGVLASLLASETCSLARAKGFVVDPSSRRRLVQVVGKRYRVHDAQDDTDDTLIGKLVCIGLADEVDQRTVQALVDELAMPESV